MILIGERKFGFKSLFHFKCLICCIKKYISTESEELMKINTLAVVGVMNIGVGFSQLEEIMCRYHGNTNTESKNVPNRT